MCVCVCVCVYIYIYMQNACHANTWSIRAVNDVAYRKCSNDKSFETIYIYIKTHPILVYFPFHILAWLDHINYFLICLANQHLRSYLILISGNTYCFLFVFRWVELVLVIQDFNIYVSMKQNLHKKRTLMWTINNFAVYERWFLVRACMKN